MNYQIKNFIETANIDNCKKLVKRYDENKYKLRNDLANEGFEFTPEELRLCISLIRFAIYQND